ncbi:hypothetical protein F4680DRAFT_96503 [Xylaria scruposa]|nr:hypothetical protein F4680DRAFT_96503 [Xylaria scruposa]
MCEPARATGRGGRVCCLDDRGDPDCIKHNKLPFSEQHHFVRSTVHYLHRTTRDFMALDGARKLLNDRLAMSKFDSYNLLAIHASIAVHEVELRARRLGLGSQDYSYFGGELAEKERTFLSYLESCQNNQVSSMLKRMYTGKGVKRSHQRPSQFKIAINNNNENNSEGKGRQLSEKVRTTFITQHFSNILPLIKSI